MKKFNKIKTFALFLLILSALTGCGKKNNNPKGQEQAKADVSSAETATEKNTTNNTPQSKEEAEKQIEDNVTSFLAKYKAKDMSSLKAYTIGSICPFENMYKPESKVSNLIFDCITNNMSYEITAINVDNDNATVDLKVTNIDMADVMSNAVNGFLEEGSKKAKENPDFDADQLLYQLIKQGIDEKASSKEDFSVTVDLARQNNKWLITDSKNTANFFDRISGKYYAYSYSASQTMSMLSGEGDK